jgi:hypothetical protein
VAGGTVAGVSLVTGIVFAALSKAKANDADAMHVDIQNQGGAAACTSGAFTVKCNTLHGIRLSQDAFADVSLWTFVAAGAVGAGTAIYGVTAPKTSRTGMVTLTPLVSAAGGGLRIAGAW